MDTRGEVDSMQESPVSDQDHLSYTLEQSPPSHERGFLALLDRFCQLEQSVEEALRQERLAREAGESVLRELVDVERQGREIQCGSLQDFLAKDLDVHKARIENLVHALVASTAPAAGGRDVLPQEAERDRGANIGSEAALDGADRGGEVKDSPCSASWQDDVSRLAQEIKQERGLREADVENLRQQLLSAGHRTVGGDLDAVGDLQELLAKEGQARELHLSSVQELLSLESEARQAHARELQAQLAAERATREQLQDDLRSALEDGLQEQGAALQQHVDRLERLVAEVSERHAAALQEAVRDLPTERAGGGEIGLELRDRLNGLERRLEEIVESCDAAGRSRACESDHLSSVEQALAEEGRARESHAASLRELLLQEGEDRQRYLDVLEEQLAGERSANECRHLALAERLGIVEASVHQAAGRQSAELSRLREELQAQLDALREGQALQLPLDQDGLLQHRQELEAHVSEQLEAVRMLLDSHREDLQAQSLRHDALCDRLSAFEQGLCESAREQDFSLAGTADSQAIQLLHDQHRQAVADHLLQEQSVREEQSRGLREELDSHMSALEAKHRSLELCLAQEREQREQHIASVHDAIRWERAHHEELHGRHEEALARERSMREQTHEELRGLLEGDRRPAQATQPLEGEDTASRVAALERTLTVLSTLVRTEQVERARALQRIWDRLESRDRGASPRASSPSTTKLAAAPVRRAASPSRLHCAAADGATSPTCRSVAAVARPLSPWHARGDVTERACSPTCRSVGAAARPLSPEPVQRSGPQVLHDFGVSAWRDPQVHTARGAVDSLAQRSSAAILEAATKVFGSTQGLPRTSTLASRPGSAVVPCSHGGAPPLARTAPAAGFAPAARAAAGAAIGPPVRLGLPVPSTSPGLSGLSQAVAQGGSFRTPPAPTWASMERCFAPPGTAFGQDPEELAL